MIFSDWKIAIWINVLRDSHKKDLYAPVIKQQIGTRNKME